MPRHPHGITQREATVLVLVAAGLSNRLIARRLVVSIRTVDSLLESARSKLGSTDRTAAVVHALEDGIIRHENIRNLTVDR